MERQNGAGRGANIATAYPTLAEAEQALGELKSDEDEYQRENYEPYRIEKAHTYGRDMYWVWCPARQVNPAGLVPPHPDWRPWLP